MALPELELEDPDLMVDHWIILEFLLDLMIFINHIVKSGTNHK